MRRIEYPGGRWFEFEYNRAGQRTKRTDQDGNVVNYHYDAAGRLDTMTDGVGALIVDYNYDAAGRLARKTLGNGVFTTNEYDAAGNVLQLVNRRADGVILSRYEYEYDASGRRVSMNTLDGKFLYGYDPLGQLNGVTHPDGRVVRYQYDAAGNRVRTSDSGVSTQYATNKLNQYTSVGGIAQHYDADGNLIEKTEDGVTTAYTCDIENRLVAVITPTESWIYTYDVFGNRIAATHGGETIQYVIDPTGLGNVAAEYEADGTLRARYDHGFGLVARVDAGGDPAFYTFQAIGHTSELTDLEGAVLNRYAFDPWGISLGKTESVHNAFEYVGEYGVTNEGNGLEFMRARFYDTSQGRFTQHDSIGIAGGANLYTYASNASGTLIDPLGLSSFEGDNGGTYNAPITLPTFWYTPTPDPRLARMSPEEFRWAFRQAGNRIRDFNEGFSGTCIAAVAAGTAVTWAGFALAAVDACNSARQWRNAYEAPSWPDNGVGSTRETRGTEDPNDKLAPGGYGESHYIAAGSAIPYTIRFENKSDATAPARLILISDYLDDDLDLSTFQITEITFARHTITVPSALDEYHAQVPLAIANEFSTSEIVVQVHATLDRTKRQFKLELQAYDPATGWYSEDPFVGLLYPNDTTGRGDGSVSYMVSPKRDLPPGAEITNRAQIVFDFNDPIDTPLVLNTLDAGTPNSRVLPLPATSPAGTFELRWTGSDEQDGSGIAAFDIYVSVDGGAPFLLLKNQTDRSMTFTAEANHVYAFYSIARDNVGHVELPPARPDVSVRILPGDTNSDGKIDIADLNGVRQYFGEVGEDLPGDVDGDGDVDIVDLNIVRAFFGEVPHFTPGDTNGDHIVDLFDLNNVRNNFGQFGPEVLGDTNRYSVVNVLDLNEVRNHFGAAAGSMTRAQTIGAPPRGESQRTGTMTLNQSHYSATLHRESATDVLFTLHDAMSDAQFHVLKWHGANTLRPKQVSRQR